MIYEIVGEKSLELESEGGLDDFIRKGIEAVSPP
jgi:hypothetical protein